MGEQTVWRCLEITLIKCLWSVDGDDRRVMSQSECENYWGHINEGVVCIDTTDGGGSCNGDSGGPLSIPGSRYEQIGIVSFGSTLGCESAPAGFTEVSKYKSWISSV